MSKSKFLKESFKNFNKMGSIVRSGHQMCEKMTQYIVPEKDYIIVEYGAGDGAITQYILDKMSKQSRLIVFEINTEMVAVLKEKFKNQSDRITIINDGAEHLEIHLETLNISSVDMFISAIPFIILPKELMLKVLNVSKRLLSKDGYFIQMHYSLQLKNVYENLFSKVESSFVPLNFPPGHVFKCS